MTARRVLAAAVCACLLAAGCSSTGSDSAVSASAAANLHSDVLALTRAAAARNWSEADGALTQLRGDLTEAVATGSVSAARAAQIEATVKTVAVDLAASSGRNSSAAASSTAPTSSSAKPSPTRTATTKPKPAPAPPPGEGKGHGKKHKHG